MCIEFCYNPATIEEFFNIIPFSRKNPYYQRSDHLDIKSFPNVPLVDWASLSISFSIYSTAISSFASSCPNSARHFVSRVLPKHPARSLILAIDLYKNTVVLLFLVRYLRLGTRLLITAHEHMLVCSSCMSV